MRYLIEGIKKGIYEKTIAVGMVSRTDGKVKIKQVSDTTSKTLQTEIHKNVKEKTNSHF